MSSIHETNPVNEAWALDVDRLLLDTEKAFGYLVSIAMDVAGVEQSELDDAKARVEASKGSFDVMGHLRANGLDEQDELEIAIRYAMNEEEVDLLYADTRLFLDELRARQADVTLLTKGSIHTQMPKIFGGRLHDWPFIITPERYKGRLIDSWRTPSGLYAVPRRTGATALSRTDILVDDKPESFVGLPEDCSGYLVLRPDDVVRGTEVNLPENVVTVPGLMEVIDHHFASAV